MLTSNQLGRLTGTLYCRRIVPLQDKLRALGQAVEFHPGTEYAIFKSALEAGQAVDAPIEDTVRPGRGLGLVVGMVVDELTPTGIRQTDVSIHRLRLPARNQAHGSRRFSCSQYILQKRPSTAWRIPGTSVLLLLCVFCRANVRHVD